ARPRARPRDLPARGGRGDRHGRLARVRLLPRERALRRAREAAGTLVPSASSFETPRFARLLRMRRSRSRASVRHQYRRGHRLDDAAGSPAEYEVAQTRVAVAAHHHEVDIAVGDGIED